MTSNYQGLTLGEQVRANSTTNALNPNYMGRTARQLSLRRQQAEFNELKNQAEQINSNIF